MGNIGRRRRIEVLPSQPAPVPAPAQPAPQPERVPEPSK
jgi:hypothetical protein